MATGLTPLLDSLIAGGYVNWFVDFRKGTFFDGINNILISPVSGSFPLQRNGLSSPYAAVATLIQSPNQTISNISECTYICYLTPMIQAGSTGVRFPQLNDGSAFMVNISGALRATFNSTGGNTQSNSAAGVFVTNVPIFCAASWRENNVTGAQCYVNGAASGASVSSVGKTSWSMTSHPFGLRMGSGSCYLVFCVGFIKKWLTTAEHAQIYDEIVNQIQYEQKSITINGSWSAGQPYWIARYGILAEETTMSAGQSIGQLNALKVSTGTHKCNTFLYGTTLAKGIKCVTAGNIILPDPLPALGGNYYYRYYDDSAGTWEDRSSASATVALDAVNDIILWSTIDGRTYLYKAA